MSQPWVICGSHVGQPWIMLVIYGVTYWSTMGYIGHTKRTLVIATPGYSGLLPFRNGGPSEWQTFGMAIDTVVTGEISILYRFRDN